MNAFILKLIACITMFIDHLGYVIYDGNISWFNCIGRLAFPIFAFQISEGYIHTKNIKKYILRLAALAIISQIPFSLFHSIINGSIALNVIFTLLFGILSILVFDKCNKILGIVTVIFLGIIAQIINCDYGFYGVIIIFLFYITKSNKKILLTSYCLATTVKFVINYSLYGFSNFKILLINNLPFFISTLLAGGIIYLYNKQKGPNTKYWLYIFYPVHLLLLYLAWTWL